MNYKEKIKRSENYGEEIQLLCIENYGEGLRNQVQQKNLKVHLDRENTESEVIEMAKRKKYKNLKIQKRKTSRKQYMRSSNFQSWLDKVF